VSAAAREYPGWSRDEQASAWLKALLRAVRAGDERLVALAQAELRALGLELKADAAKVRA
jgi:hypothetical protein